MTDSRHRAKAPTAAARIASGGIAVSLTLGMVGLIAVRAAADENSSKEKPAPQTTQPTGATDAVSAALAAEQARSDIRVAKLRAQYEASLKRLAQEYQAKLQAAVPQEVVTVAGAPEPAAPGDSSGSGVSADSGSGGGYDTSAGSGSGGGYDTSAGSGSSSSGSYSSGGSSGGSSGSSSGGSSSGSSGGGAAPQAPAVTGGS